MIIGFIRIVLIFLIKNLRPLLGPACCVYSQSCTPFAIEQLQKKPLHRALWAISIRVLSCNPFHRVHPAVPAIALATAGSSTKCVSKDQALSSLDTSVYALSELRRTLGTSASASATTTR